MPQNNDSMLNTCQVVSRNYANLLHKQLECITASVYLVAIMDGEVSRRTAVTQLALLGAGAGRSRVGLDVFAEAPQPAPVMEPAVVASWARIRRREDA